MKLEFESQDNQSKNVLITDNLSIGYTLDKPLLENLNLHIRAGQRIGLTGSNGTGKTTLIRTIAGKLRPLAGSLKLGATVKLGYMTQEQELLNPDFNVLQTVQSVASFNETEARNFLHYFLLKVTMRFVPHPNFHSVNAPACNWEHSSHRDARSFYSTNPSTTSTFHHAPASKKRSPTSKGRS